MIQGFTAIFASFGFAILFNIKGDKLFTSALIGGIGGVIYDLFIFMNYSQAISLFIASICISLLSELFARLLKCPVTTFLICAIIPLVPGGGMYYTMLEIVKNNVEGALLIGIDTIVQACSIAIGCILVSSIMKLYKQIMSRGKKSCQK